VARKGGRAPLDPRRRAGVARKGGRDVILIKNLINFEKFNQFK